MVGDKNQKKEQRRVQNMVSRIFKKEIRNWWDKQVD